MKLPIDMTDVRRAESLIRPFFPPTPLRNYPLLDRALGVRVLVKHENHLPTGAFKVRNAIVAVSALTAEERARGVVTATRGNHGQGVGFVCRALGVPATVCVPHQNNVEKNDAMRALGVTLVEVGDSYEDAVAQAELLVRERGMTLVHSTNNPHVIAGGATLSLEIVREAPEIGAIVVALGGGSQAVGAITVTRALAPHVAVYAVQAENAPTVYESIKAGVPVSRPALPTLADGLATASTYPLTLEPLRVGLADVVTVSEAEIAAAMRDVMRTTHNMLEGAAAAAFAGVRKLSAPLGGKTVAVVLSGANVEQQALARVLSHAV